MGKFEQALKDYYAILEIDNNFLYAFHGIGFAYYFLNKYDEALYNFRRVTRIDSKHFNAYLMIVIIFIERGELHESLNWINHLIEINPYSILVYEIRAEVFGILAESAEPPRDSYYRSRALQDEEMVLRLGNR